jgi:hypothetical protein
MSLCKLEFFDRKFHYVHHAIADIEELDDDYLSPEKSDVLIDKTDLVKANHFVWITGGFQFLGIVTEVEVEDDQTKINFSPFVSMFDKEVLISTNGQASAESDSTWNKYDIEETIAQSIYAYWVNSVDTEWNVNMQIYCKYGSDTPWASPVCPSPQVPNAPREHVSVRCSKTLNYTLELSADEFGKSRMKVNLLDDILMKAVKYYGVVVRAVPNFSLMQIDVFVSTQSGYRLRAFEESSDADYAVAMATVQNINADETGVNIEQFTLDSASSDANTLMIYSTANTTDRIAYYLCNDGKSPSYCKAAYLKTDSNPDGRVRILPPKLEIGFASNITTAADKKAKEFFKDLVWNSSAELVITNNDTLIHPEKLEIGQICRLWHNGESHMAILTARKFGDETTLVFGSIRTTLTKQMKLQKKKKK